MNTDPIEILRGGIPVFEWPDGTRVPIVRGGDGDGDDGDGGGGDDDGGGGDGGGSADGELDLERAKAKIAKANSEAAGLRKRLKEAEEKARLYDEAEDGKKSEVEKLTSKVTEAEKRAGEAELTALRLEVALDKAPEAMPIAQVRKLAKRLTGATREEIEADADELFEDFKTDDGKGSNNGGPARRPAENLRGGGAGDTETEPNVAEIVKSIPRL